MKIVLLRARIRGVAARLLFGAFGRSGSRMGWSHLRTGTRFKSKHLLADGTQCLLFFSQDVPDLFVGDLTLAKPLDHVPYLSAVIVGPFLKSVRRAQNYRIGLHLALISSNY